MKALLAISFIVLSLLAVLLACARFMKGRAADATGNRFETTRKLVHLVMGALCLTFPWLFDAPQPVFVLAAFVSSMFIYLRFRAVGCLRPVLFGVERQSYGELFFPLAVALIFFLAKEPVYFLVPIAVLAFADSAAALIGTRFGSRIYYPYRLKHGAKSVEGSLAFLLMAFGTSMVVLAFSTTLPFYHVLMLAALLAALSTVVESLCFSGLDNLFVPLALYFALSSALSISVAALTVELVSLIASTLLVFLLKRSSTLADGGTLFSLAYLYLAITEGGMLFFILPLVLLASYKTLLPRRFRLAGPVHGQEAVFAFLPAALLFLPGTTFLVESNTLLLAYGMAFAIHGSIIASAHIRLVTQDQRQLRKDRLVVLSINALKSWCLFFLPCVFMGGKNLSPWFTLLAFLYVLLFSLIFALRRSPEESRTAAKRWFRQGTLASLGSLGFLVCLA